MNCCHPEEAIDIKEVYIGESPVTQMDIYTTAYVCGICNQTLDTDVPVEEHVSESD